MTESKHGGKREGSGRPKGSIKINAKLQESFREHTETALKSIVDIAKDKGHQHHLRACELILNRGYGTTTATTEASDIIDMYLNDDISAIRAGLLLESKGLKVGELLSKYITNERLVASKNEGFTIGAKLLSKG